MTLLTRYPIRFIIPLTLVFVVLASCGFVYVFNNVDRLHIIEEEVMSHLLSGMHRRQTRMERYWRDGDMERLQQEVATIILDDPEDNVVVINEQQKIISASTPAWVGLPLAKAPLLVEGKTRLAGVFAGQVQAEKGGEFLSQDRQTAYAFSPLMLKGDGKLGPPHFVGMLYHEQDIRVEKAIVQKTVLRYALWFFCLIVFLVLVLWFYLYFVFFRRVRLIMQTMERFGLGQNTARSGLTGNDELASVSAVLDGMLDQRVVTEGKVREQANLLKQLTDGLPVLIAYVDKEERYRFVNQEFEKWFYLKPEQIMGRRVSELLGKQGFGELAEQVHQALNGKEVEFESTIPIVANGMRKFHAILLPHFENGSEVTGCFLLAQDITRQQADQEKIRQAKKLWEHTFDAIVDEIITIQDKDFRILQANSAAATFFGIPREEIVGRHCYELFRKDEIPCHECPAHAVMQDGKSHRTELYYQRLQKNFLVTMTPMNNEKGEFSGIIHSAKDITEFKRLEQQLRQAQKMEAIGTLAGGIAHDFNNILTPILGYSELIAEQLPTGSKEHRMVQEIRTACLRATNLVKQILTFSRQNEQQQQPIQIHLIIKEALKLLRSSIPTTIAIHQDIADCGLVMADPTQIHQVLMNLCTNAYHALRESGGDLSVSLSMVELTAQDNLDKGIVIPGPHVKLSVRDNGSGMSKELQERIFEPYFTTKKQGEGTGLGLSVVHGIVQSHHGHITVYSEPGYGTEFHVYLPQLKALDAELAEETEAEAIPQGSGTVLVVDDEAVIGLLLRDVLLSLGYEVILCTSSTQALETFQQKGAAIDLVLTDMTMPVMDGAELAGRIKQLRPATPVVLCTGFSDIIDEEKAKRLGIDGYLTKPIIKRHLAQTLYDVLRKKGATGSGQ